METGSDDARVHRKKREMKVERNIVVVGYLIVWKSLLWGQLDQKRCEKSRLKYPQSSLRSNVCRQGSESGCGEPIKCNYTPVFSVPILKAYNINCRS